jgi:hypothetical protein
MTTCNDHPCIHVGTPGTIDKPSQITLSPFSQSTGVDYDKIGPGHGTWGKTFFFEPIGDEVGIPLVCFTAGCVDVELHHEAR